MSVHFKQPGGSVDLSAVDQDIVPDDDGTRVLGGAGKTFQSVYAAEIISESQLAVVGTSSLLLNGGAEGVYAEGHLIPNADSSFDIGVQTTAQWANVWADAINGADFIMANGVRMLEGELYGKGRSFAIGYSPRWESGKAIWHGSAEQKAAWMTGAQAWLLVTEDALEIHGRRFTPEMLDRLLRMLTKEKPIERNPS